MPERIGATNVYAKVLVALLILTATTCGVSYIDMGRMNVVVAVVIAFAKASLVALIFMHLRYSRHLMSLVVVGGLFWLGILIALTLGDYLTRGWK
jgi:cytochrome c oxidase subunit 4